jgi:glycosyltransferase involved in cell wall biosynthesis
MRIGIDATALPPKPVGAGIYTINLVRSLHALKLEDDLIVFATPRGRDLINLSEREGFRWVVVPELNPGRRLLWEQVVFPSLARRNELDLLHSLHYTKPIFLSCASVVTFHDMTFLLYPQLHTRVKRIIFPLFIRISARQAAALIAVSESTRQDSIRLLNLPAHKIHSIPLGAGKEFRRITDALLLEEVRRKYKLPSEFILYTGLVEPRKNLTMLIRAYANLVNRGIREALVIVGRFGWMSDEIFAQVERAGLGNKVVFTGYIEQEDLPPIYNLASIFVYPTLYEGFGLPVLEAMACGTAVITSAVSSLPEIVAEAGVLLPPGDEEALSNAIYHLVSDPAGRKQLADSGLARAKQFTWQNTAMETHKVYQLVEYDLFRN